MSSDPKDYGSDISSVVRTGPYPELTWTAIIVGWILGSIIAVSIAYAALILGFSIEGSELAAILGWGILRGVLRRTSIVENNINQTIASSVNGASSGIMFTVPALFILAKTQGLETVDDFEWSTIFLIIFASITGCILGLAFVIPLRKQMIDFDRLAYPGGIAVATILKSPGAGMKKAVFLLGRALFSAIIHIIVLVFLGEDWHLGEQLGLPSMLNITLFLSVMTIGVGYLSGKGGFWFGAGGFICYWVLAPILGLIGHESTNNLSDPPIRPSIVYTAENPIFNSKKRDAVRHRNAIAGAIAALRELDEAAADSFSELTGIVVPPKDSDAPLFKPEDKQFQFPKTKFRDLLDVELANNIIATANRLTDHATSLKEFAKQENRDNTSEESETIKTCEGAAEGLLKATRAKSIVAAAKAIETLPETQRNALFDATRVSEIKGFVADTDLDVESAKQIMAASWSDSYYKKIPEALRLKLFRPTGIGMLIGAALGGILAAFPLILSALRSMQAASKQKSTDRTVQNDEMPIRLLYAAIILGAIAMVAIAFMSVNEMTLWRATLMAVLGTVWVWIAGVIVAECIGRTNWSPLSGMTLIAVTIVVIIAKPGMRLASAVLSSMIVGAAICMAVSQASDMMLDLKSGYLVGAIPRRQQYAQYIGVWLGPIIVVALMLVLHKTYVMGSDKLPAPQATALASVIDGIMSGNVPDYRYAAGGGLGLLLALSGLGGIGVLVGLGFYMPFNIVLTYTIGNILRIVSDRTLGKKFAHDVGIPIAAGFIVGEALVGVGNALYMVFIKGG